MLVWVSLDDTHADLKATLIILSKNTDVIAPNVATPYPGTKFYEEPKALGVCWKTDGNASIRCAL
jgi:uncharacterized radical SAM superfamily protein